jgi:hypothetical protein
MPEYTQAHSVFRHDAPRADVLLLRRITGTEGISELFDLELEALASNGRTSPSTPSSVSPTVSVHLGSATVRWFNGLCIELRREPGRPSRRIRRRSRPGDSDRAKIWVLGLAHRSRVFQEITVPAILKKVFDGFPTEDRLKERTSRGRCAQYRENDLAFACRLMEEEGSAGSSGTRTETTRSSSPTAARASTFRSRLPLRPLEGRGRDEDRIAVWKKEAGAHARQGDASRPQLRGADERPREGRPAQGDAPGRDRLAQAAARRRRQAGALRVSGRPRQALRRGHAGRRRPGVGDQKIFPYGDVRARVVMEREETRRRDRGAGTVRHMVPGFQFTFDKHHDGNGSTS